ncbi:enterochelin esterase [Vibrio ziniensis]|uniref:Enterochelin esterase n=1 Tax=Vibrio ziniensis TaxID=2711221 RepID=A0A6G7CL30_9VIBR|nr:enterochelin esterase [Vibrio ziniensis]QIH42756.1 enterochelin esterase [Vibrio ziniensis]
MDLQALTQQTELNQFDIGSSQWWDKVSQVGTPIQISRNDGTADLLFLWQEQTIEPKHKAIYIEINGVINHHDFNAAELTHYKNTDVYYYVCNIEDTWNGTYALIPVTEESVQPAYLGNEQQQITQHRNWIMERRKHHIADPFNKMNLHYGPWAAAHSRAYLDPNVIHPSWTDFDNSTTKVDWSELCRTHIYQSKLLQQNRRFWTYSTAEQTDSDLPLVILLDGEFWVESMPVMSPLSSCTQKELLPPAVYLMIDAISVQQRGEDLTCNPVFWHAVIEEMIPMVAQHHSISLDKDKTIVTGQSYGGLSALYAVLNWPERFGKALSQSGSFWWPHMSLIHNSHQEDIVMSLPESLYLDKYISSLDSQYKLDVYLEVGLREQMMIPLAEHMHRKLSTENHNSTLSFYDGGHDRLIWREGLIKGLTWLFKQ